MAKRKKTRKKKAKKIVTPKSLEEPELSETPVIDNQQANAPVEPPADKSEGGYVFVGKGGVAFKEEIEKKVKEHKSIPAFKDMPVIERSKVPSAPITEPKEVVLVTCSGCKAQHLSDMVKICPHCKNQRFCISCAKPKSCHKCGKALQ